MSKKSSSNKPLKKEVSTGERTEPNSQFDVVPVDETPQPEANLENPAPDQLQDQAEITPTPEVEPTVNPQPEQPLEAQAQTDASPDQQPPPKPKPLTMVSLKAEIDELRSLLQTQSQQIADLMAGPVLKRKPTTNGKVQIKDKTTGKLYPSKNNVYQTLLRDGFLDELVNKGVFGDIPNKNSFGWYALNRNFPGRFEEVN